MKIKWGPFEYFITPWKISLDRDMTIKTEQWAEITDQSVALCLKLTKHG